MQERYSGSGRPYIRNQVLQEPATVNLIELGYTI